MKTKFFGFTLIEVVVAIAIISILAAIAYPSYLSQVRKSNRSDAKVALTSVAQRMQRCFTSAGKYNPSAGTCAVVDDVTGSGISSDQGYYLVKLADADVTATTYILKATPVSGTPQAQDTQCAVLTLNQIGVQGASDSSNNDTSDTCW